MLVDNCRIDLTSDLLDGIIGFYFETAGSDEIHSRFTPTKTQ